ncbi:hypothetical protein FHG89_32345 [Micromonospora orduensis]|uniref:Uncharacterized protein n=1 Tax=Micromonospora orduensis TaxID=1420891 RepID=A0A5C4QAL4_9ACTN|nr:hypothetical protein FHG89_32345 [Micromonospora orduensis]
MPARPSRWSRPLRVLEPSYLQAFVLSGVVTVLVTRAFLQVSGYPQLGGGQPQRDPAPAGRQVSAFVGDFGGDLIHVDRVVAERDDRGRVEDGLTVGSVTRRGPAACGRSPGAFVAQGGAGHAPCPQSCSARSALPPQGVAEFRPAVGIPSDEFWSQRSRAARVTSH